MSLLDSKVKECIIDIIQSYNYYKKMPKFVNFSLVAETDGTFSQIVIRTLIDDVWFTDPSYGPLFGPFGAAIAQGEEKFFIQKILEEIQDYQQLNLNDFTFELLTEKILSTMFPENLLILVPIKTKYNHMLMKRDMWPIEYDYELKSFILNLKPFKVPIYSIHEDLINSYVICLNKDFGKWFYKMYDNPYDPTKEETIFTEIKRAEEPSKVEILVRSLVKFQIYDLDRIRILKIT